VSTDPAVLKCFSWAVDLLDRTTVLNLAANTSSYTVDRLVSFAGANGAEREANEYRLRGEAGGDGDSRGEYDISERSMDKGTETRSFALLLACLGKSVLIISDP
jgi:hypothetical protein